MRESNAPGLPRRASSESAAATSAVSASVSASTQRQAEKRQHALRAVEEREAFFGFERDGRNVCALHGFAAGENFVPDMSARAFADHDLREVRERSEVAGCADRTLRGNYADEPGVQHFAERLRRFLGGCRSVLWRARWRGEASSRAFRLR